MESGGLADRWRSWISRLSRNSNQGLGPNPYAVEKAVRPANSRQRDSGVGTVSRSVLEEHLPKASAIRPGS